MAGAAADKPSAAALPQKYGEGLALAYSVAQRKQDCSGAVALLAGDPLLMRCAALVCWSRQQPPSVSSAHQYWLARPAYVRQILNAKARVLRLAGYPGNSGADV